MSTNDYREALQRVVAANEHMTDGADRAYMLLHDAIEAAKQLLARPEPQPPSVKIEGSEWLNVRIHKGDDVIVDVKDLLKLANPSPRITREEASERLRAFASAAIENYANRSSLDADAIDERLRKLDEATAECLAVMNVPRITREEADKRLDRYYQARHKQECFDAPLDTQQFTNPRAEMQESTAGVLDAMGVDHEPR